MSRWRIAAVATALAGYALLSHGLMTWWPEQPWSIAVLFGPLLIGLLTTGLVKRHVPSLLGAAGLGLVLALVQQHDGGSRVEMLYVLQHAAMHAVMAYGFGITLRAGSTPLITQMAARLQRHLPDAQRVYTRRLTAVWCGYFIGMIGLSLLLYRLAPWSWWSFYCNVLTPLAALALFVGEYLLRYRLHPEFERVTLASAWQAWQATQGRPSVDARP